MSFLLNKRKRDDSSNESLSLPNNDTSKNYQENNNNNEINMQEEEILNEENVNMNIDNSQKNNNKLDAFQIMFQSIKRLCLSGFRSAPASDHSMNLNSNVKMQTR